MGYRPPGIRGGQVSVPLVIRTPGGDGQQLSATHGAAVLERWPGPACRCGPGSAR